jgi:hypothetical protein
MFARTLQCANFLRPQRTTWGQTPRPPGGAKLPDPSRYQFRFSRSANKNAFTFSGNLDPGKIARS